MPAVLRFLNHRVMIHTNDHRPSHVHVYPDAGGEAQFWLDCPHGPPHLKLLRKVSKPAARRIQKHLASHLSELCAEWRRIHGNFR